MYDLNQVPSDYTVEVRNRFMVPDLIDRMPDELWMEVHDMQTSSSNNTGEDYTWASPDGQHRNQIDCVLYSQRWRSSI